MPFLALTSGGEELTELGRVPVSFSPAQDHMTVNEQTVRFPALTRPLTVDGFLVYERADSSWPVLEGPLDVTAEAGRNDTLEFLKGAVRVSWKQDAPFEPLCGGDWDEEEEEDYAVDPWPVTDGWFVSCPFCGQKVAQGVGHECSGGQL
jgi:hypothetical protein